jgi:hypothetical protein
MLSDEYIRLFTTVIEIDPNRFPNSRNSYIIHPSNPLIPNSPSIVTITHLGMMKLLRKRKHVIEVSFKDEEWVITGSTLSACFSEESINTPQNIFDKPTKEI